MQQTQQQPLSLYVHVPWCIRKCPYCDFNSHAQTGELPEGEYLAALLKDLESDLAWYGKPAELHSIFIGGGTPSLLSGSFYTALMDALHERATLPTGIEITLEANPGTHDSANFIGFRQAGVSRLSIGVQSFDDASLLALGRIHDSAEAHKTFAKARRAGLDNINIDLMHGLPGQSVKTALRDIEQAIALGPEHISWYQLTIEPNTAFYSAPPMLPEENVLEDIQQAGLALLEAAGYAQYEVSAFARAGGQSQHNLNYWMFGDYIGIGAGAHGKLTRDGEIFRRWKTRAPVDYLQGTAVLAGEKKIARCELPLEFMMNALRLKGGFDLRDFEARTRLPGSALEPAVTALCERGLLCRNGTAIVATAMGWRFLDEVVQAFLPNDASL